jgi:calmodulin
LIFANFTGTSDITEQQFITFMSKKSDNNADESELLKAFQVFDKDASGTISTAELRYVLCVLGEKLDDAIVESMLNQADPSGEKSCIVVLICSCWSRQI